MSGMRHRLGDGAVRSFRGNDELGEVHSFHHLVALQPFLAAL